MTSGKRIGNISVPPTMNVRYGVHTNFVDGVSLPPITRVGGTVIPISPTKLLFNASVPTPPQPPDLFPTASAYSNVHTLILDPVFAGKVKAWKDAIDRWDPQAYKNEANAKGGVTSYPSSQQEPVYDWFKYTWGGWITDYPGKKATMKEINIVGKYSNCAGGLVKFKYPIALSTPPKAPPGNYPTDGKWAKEYGNALWNWRTKGVVEWCNLWTYYHKQAVAAKKDADAQAKTICEAAAKKQEELNKFYQEVDASKKSMQESYQKQQEIEAQRINTLANLAMQEGPEKSKLPLILGIGGGSAALIGVIVTIILVMKKKKGGAE